MKRFFIPSILTLSLFASAFAAIPARARQSPHSSAPSPQPQTAPSQAENTDPITWLTQPPAPAHPVAVFYLHPTSYFRPGIGNAPSDHGLMVDRLNDATLRTQASAFAACCDVWAPHYRQSSLQTVLDSSPQAYAANNLAYTDIDRAFTLFVAELKGRPFIVASHSQGSLHALRLLQQRIVGTPLQKYLVAAYLPGVALPRDILGKGLPVCINATATGCVVSWNTVRSGTDDPHRTQDAIIWWEGHYEPIHDRPLVCVNPVNWVPDGAAPNPGAISVYAAQRGGAFTSPVAALAHAECQTNGLLGIGLTPSYQPQFSDMQTGKGIYQDFDYTLFWGSIAQNANLRIARFSALPK